MVYGSSVPAIIRKATGAIHGGDLNRHRRPRAVHPAGVNGLMYAAQQGDVRNVRKIIHNKPEELLEKDRTGKSSLHYCCTSDSICAAQAADLLVMAAPDLVEGRDDDGFTPLHLAVIAGNMPLVTFLIANHADVSSTDNEKHTVVHWATVCGETTALRAVLAAGAPVSTPDVHGGYPLHYAAQMCGGEKEGDLGMEVLQTLLNHPKAEVSVKDGDQREPLLWAASAGSSKAMLALIRAGAPIESSDKDGLTALHCAASRGHTDCLDSLLTLCGASPDVIDSNGCTALHYAVTLGHADATAILLAHGADPNRQDRKGRSPAHCGCAKGQLETVKMISAHGANLWLRNARGDFPLHDAAASGRRDLVKWLLEMRPSQVNARNNDGRCPLHLAALNDNPDMCKILLDAGAQINPILRTSKNVFMTPLDCALQRGFRSTAKYLQLHGGIPANRLGAAVASQIQIRDDVTIWGTSSSESEREQQQQAERRNKKIFRRKTQCGSRKNPDLSGSASSKRKTAKSGRLDYTNEIIINGKTEINIHQTREISVENTPVPEGAFKAEQKDQSTNTTSDDTSHETETVIENDRKETAAQLEKSDTLPDQQSLLSNTSEDVEETAKNLIVEASVHAPPKNLPPSEQKSKIERSLSKLQKQETIREDSACIPGGEETSQTKIEHRIEEEAAQEQQDDQSGKMSPEKIEQPSQKQENQENLEDEELAPQHEVDFKSTTELESLTQKQHEEVVDLSKEDQKEEETELSSLKREGVEKLYNFGKESAEKSGEQENLEMPTDLDNQKQDNIVEKDQDQEQVSLPKTCDLVTEEDQKLPLKQPEEEVKVSRSEESALEKVTTKTGTPKLPEAEEAPQASQKEAVVSGASSPTTQSSDSSETKTHKSFRVLDELEAQNLQSKNTRQSRRLRDSLEKQRSRSEESKPTKTATTTTRRSKIPTPRTLTKTELSKSDKTLYARVKKPLDSKIPSLPNIYSNTKERPDSNLSAPLPASVYSDVSDVDEFKTIPSSFRRKRVKKRAKARDSRSAGSDYESSNLIDSGFEPSPRSNRPKWRNMSERGVNMSSVTQSIQTNIRRYHLERKIFQHLLDLKRLQIRAGQHNEAMLVKRAIDGYHQSCASTVGAGRYVPEDFSFKSFEKFLYHALRRLQRNGTPHLRGLPETPRNPLLCTKSTHRCMHATHAYTGIPCAAYLPKMDHHSIPKIGFNGGAACRPGTGPTFLPNIGTKKAVTLELCHGGDKQIISLPADRLDQNKRYYVTFTIKGQNGDDKDGGESKDGSHQHSKSD